MATKLQIQQELAKRGISIPQQQYSNKEIGKELAKRELINRGIIEKSGFVNRQPTMTQGTIPDAIWKPYNKLADFTHNIKYNWAEKDYADNIKNPVGRFAASIPQAFHNAPNKLIKSVVAPVDEQQTTSDLLKRTGQAVEGSIDIMAPFAGGSVAKNIAKAPLKEGIGNLFMQGAKQAWKPGMAYGGAYGFGGGLQEGNSVKEQLINAGKQSVMGSIVGGVGGFVLGGAGSVGGRVWSKGAAELRKRKILKGSIVKGDLVNIESQGDILTGKIAKIEPEKNTLTFIGETGKSVKFALNEVGLKIRKAGDENRSLAQKMAGGYEFLFQSGKAKLEKQGQFGKAIIRKIEDNKFHQAAMRGFEISSIKRAAGKLKLNEREAVGAALRGERTLKGFTENQRLFYTFLDKYRKSAFKEAQGYGLKTHTMKNGKMVTEDMKEVKNYFPIGYSEKVMSSEKFKKDTIAKFKDVDGMSDTEARNFFTTIMEDPTKRKAGHLEYARTMGSPDFEKDPLVAFTKYADQKARRLSMIDSFGKDGEKIEFLYQGLEDSGFDSATARKMFELEYGRNTVPKFIANMAQINMFRSLSLGFVINLTQLGNAAQKASFKELLGTMRKSITKGGWKEMKDFANTVGALDHNIFQQEMGGFTLHKMTEAAMYLFSKSEEYNRIISSNLAGNRRLKGITGKNLVPYADRMMKQFNKNQLNSKQGQTALRQLKSLGIDPTTIKSGRLTDKDLQRAAYEFVNRTQFRVDSMSVPPSWRSNTGRFISQFKSFSFMQTKFIRDEILKEANNGNIYPLVKYITTAYPAYYFAGKFKDNIKGKFFGEEEDDSNDEKAWKKSSSELVRSMLGGTGSLPGDIGSTSLYLKNRFESPYNGAYDKASALTGALGGPSVSLGAQISDALLSRQDISKDNLQYREDNQLDANKQLKRLLVGSIPYVGPGLKENFLKFSPRKSIQFKRDIMDKLRGGDLEGAINIFKEENHSQNGLEVLKRSIKEWQIEQLPQAEQDMYNAAKKARTEANYQIYEQ